MTSPFAELLTNTVSILKKNGERIDNVQAAVAAGGIMIQRPDILIEVNDLIQHEMSNGAIDTYLVLDPGFHEKFHGIPASYQTKTKKLGVAESQSRIQNFTYNLNGPNSRVNNNSTDASVNVVNVNGEITNQVTKLRSEVSKHVNGDDLINAMSLIDGIENEALKEAPNKAIIGALGNSLPAVGSVASILSLLGQMIFG